VKIVTRASGSPPPQIYFSHPGAQILSIFSFVKIVMGAMIVSAA
jgi:hypothetical protein